jgi:hypothetical protein
MTKHLSEQGKGKLAPKGSLTGRGLSVQRELAPHGRAVRLGARQTMSRFGSRPTRTVATTFFDAVSITATLSAPRTEA